MTQILIIIAPLFIIIFAAAILQKRFNVGDEWLKVLNSLALNVGFPVLIFSSLIKVPLSLSSQLPLLISNSILISGGFVMAFIIGKILRLDKKMLRTFFICFSFSNFAYLGMPVLTQVYGDSILPTASLIVAVYLFFLFTFGIGFLDYEKEKRAVFKKILKDLIKNPLLISVMLGIIVVTFSIPIPGILMKSLDMITASVTPTVLIVLGLFLGKSEFGKLTDWIPAGIFSLLRLLAVPACFYLGLKFSGYMPNQFSASIIESAMPLAITPFALAYKFDLNKEFIVRSIVLSTIISIFTLPFWISIM